MPQAGESLILGLDLGANSIGWALTREQNGDPVRLVAAGVRIFDAGVEGDIQAGKDESRTVARRNARLSRRQTERRARRRSKLANTLQRAKLLPEGNLKTPQERHTYFTTLDRSIRLRYEAEAPETFPHIFPYWLRARALDQRLELDEIGRALYHLGQRRGFLSNRKAAGTKKDEDRGAVKQGIAELSNLMQEARVRTLGEYFSTLDPVDPAARRIRERWTSRKMYEDEFDAIWKAQAKHHPNVLTEALYADIHNAIFRQRPLKTQSHLVGSCQFELDRKRAPMALLLAQRFRLLQRINSLRVVDREYRERDLESDERKKLLVRLETQEELKFSQARKLLGLPAGFSFNLERGGEERLVGNRTGAKLRRIFGERWDAFTQEQRDAIVEDVRSFESDQALSRKGLGKYELDPEAAKALGSLELEPGYCGLSRQALAKLVPLLEEGVAYTTAVQQIYGDQGETPGTALLPSVCSAIEQRLIPQLRNPAVNRVLVELSKVVNAIIGRYGKPDRVRIELARDLKKPREARKRISQQMRLNEKARKAASSKILNETDNSSPSREDVERVLLAEECNWECPYTGKPISIGTLLGEVSQFDVEHIIPFSRSLDNSFMNKTLCYHEENRHRKRNKTPFEAYGSNASEWEAILQRVARFRGDAREQKKRRFLMETTEEFEDFTQRQLNDTRYASTLAAKYLNILYGSDYRKHIQVSTGSVTKYVRDVWNLNKILGDGGVKSRDDHRHHAVDAIAIALTSPKTVKALSQAAERAETEKRKWFAKMPPPWDSFLQDVQAVVDKIVVSHRVSRKVNGRLHEDTFYSVNHRDEKGNPRVHVRKRIDALSAKEVDAIVDTRVRVHVKEKLAELGIEEPKRAFATRENHPLLPSQKGSGTPIHKVRVGRVAATFQVAKDCRARYVTTDSNHHMEVLETTDHQGRVKWNDLIVSQYEALQRLRRREPVVVRDHGGRGTFLFSLSSGDSIEMDDDDGNRSLFVVRTVSKDYVAFVRSRDARLSKDIVAAKEWGALRLNGIRRRNCRKVVVTPLGEVRRAND